MKKKMQLRENAVANEPYAYIWKGEEWKMTEQGDWYL